MPVQWVAPDGPVRTGDVLAPVGAKRGSLVQTWVDEAGDFVDPPPGHSEVVGNVFMSVALAGLCMLALLIAAETAALHLLRLKLIR